MEKDIPRTFVELGMFAKGGPLEEPLRDILEAYGPLARARRCCACNAQTERWVCMRVMARRRVVGVALLVSCLWAVCPLSSCTPIASSPGFTFGRYVFFRPDVGYVQGMSHLAAMLLLNLDVFPAFVAFANLLQVQHGRADHRSHRHCDCASIGFGAECVGRVRC
jgi:hypothetical protein